MSRLLKTSAPFALALALAVGFQLVWFIGCSWLASMFEPRAVYERIQFQSDGTPIVVDNSDEKNRYHDIEGRPVEFSLASQTNFYSAMSLERIDQPKRRADKSKWYRQISAYADYRKPAGYWYLVTAKPEGLGSTGVYFVGYDSRSNERIGFIGASGFNVHELPIEQQIDKHSVHHTKYTSFYLYYPYVDEYSPVADDLAPWLVFILSRGRPDKIRCFDLQERTTRVVFENSEIQSAAVGAAPVGPEGAQRNRLLVRLADEVLLIGPKDVLERRTPIPASIRDKSFNTWFPAEDGSATVTVLEPDDDLEPVRKGECFRLAADGKVISQSPIRLRQGNQQYFRWLAAIVVPMPALIDSMVLFFLPEEYLESGIAKSDSEARSLALRHFWPSVVIAHLIGLGALIPTLIRERRFARQKTDAFWWSIFVLAFGLPGWFGFRLAQNWPPQQRCKSCGNLAPMDRVECSNCNVDFPIPEPRGIEIFG